MLRRHVFYAVMLSVQGLLGPAGVLALQVQGTVFVDANGNGQRDADEQGLQGVMVSDGVTVVDTGADGAYTIEAAGAPALVWVSLPRDYQVVGRFWHWTDGSKPADFALAASSQPDEFTSGTFQPFIGDAAADPERVDTLLLCSGRVTWDLMVERAKQEDAGRFAIGRVEQLGRASCRERVCWIV